MIEIWILNFFSGLVISSLFIIFSAINCAKKPKASPPTPAAAAPPHSTPPPTPKKSAETKKAEDLKPQVFEKNEKEKMIAEGQVKRNKHDYPTFDDVVSDWESEEDGEGGGKKKKKKGEKKDGDSGGKKDGEKAKSKLNDGGEKKSK